MIQIFNEVQQKKVDFILNHPLAKLSDLRSHEIQKLAVVWSYYSAKIASNAYTYVEVEALLKDGITSEKRYEDASILKCLYNMFISKVECVCKKKRQVIIDGCILLGVHKALQEAAILNDAKVCYYKALEKSHTEHLTEDFQKLVVEAEITALQKYLSIMA
ncbi:MULTISPECIES: hypothetical protein [Parabacteroides]|uniref:hypothetical protein n=1 Tax=Parabacteroides leei TaxID=2939491 RepID=UPI001E4D8771|nr:hypothetical protein [Parabacteroides goldsteinii]